MYRAIPVSRQSVAAVCGLENWAAGQLWSAQIFFWWSNIFTCDPRTIDVNTWDTQLQQSVTNSIGCYLLLHQCTFRFFVSTPLLLILYDQVGWAMAGQHHIQTQMRDDSSWSSWDDSWSSWWLDSSRRTKEVLSQQEPGLIRLLPMIGLSQMPKDECWTIWRGEWTIFDKWSRQLQLMINWHKITVRR